jgi:transposase
MAQERLGMREVRQILQLHFEQNQSPRMIAKATNRGRTTIQDYIARAKQSALLSWDQIATVSDIELEERLGFKKPGLFGTLTSLRKSEQVMPDWQEVHREMSKRHVTMMLLWTEYRETYGENAYGYTQFREHYNRWCSKLSVVMRQTHKAGEKTFIDYSGDGPVLTDAKTGEQTKLELFVAVLGASSYTYAEATLTQTSPDWINSHVRMTEFFGGSSEIWIPDNLRSGVTRADRYEALLNETYRECSRHYGACVIPARSQKPKDKAKAESGVLVAQRWILARLRNRLFTSLTEINEAIRECLEIINDRKMRHVNKSRLELFNELERSTLKPMPGSRYEYAVWKFATVNIDYHITFDHHHYSVPYQLVREKCDVRATATTIEIFHRGKRMASHRRSHKKGGYTTCKEHMPKSHREHADWTPERVVKWSKTIGENTALLVEKILSTKVHPQQGFRSALGLIRLADRYGKERVERASRRALELGAHSYKFVADMLKNKMDQALPVSRDIDNSPMIEERDPITNEPQMTLLSAENVRGSGYYH